MAVKVGGMCWVMRTGAWSMTGPISATIALSACGPPVEAPISNTRGVVAGSGRNRILSGSGAPGARLGASSGGCASRWSARAGATARLDAMTRGAIKPRLRRAPSARILSINSRWKDCEVVNSRLLSGLGI